MPEPRRQGELEHNLKLITGDRHGYRLEGRFLSFAKSRLAEPSVTWIAGGYQRAMEIETLNIKAIHFSCLVGAYLSCGSCRAVWLSTSKSAASIWTSEEQRRREKKREQHHQHSCLLAVAL